MPQQHDLSVDGALGDRQVLPRWRSPAESIEELSGSGPRQIDPRIGSKWLTKLRADLEESPSESSARELQETAFVLGLSLGRNEVETVNDLMPQARPAPAFSGIVLTTALPRMDSGSSISEIRGKVVAYPRQPLAWAELSRQYLSTGQPEKAEKAMTCALSLAPANKFVVRSAVRLYAVRNEFDRALSLLKRHNLTSQDPWLLAAEVATASLAQRTSRFMPAAQRMLDRGGEHPRRFAELAAAVGTVEHHNGRHKKAKKLIAQSLQDPTENALAQALWISQQDEKISVPEAALSTPDSYEALARAAYANGDWTATCAQAYRWLLDEPFDPRAAVLGSAIGFVPDLSRSAVDIATRGLLAVKDNPSLLNNRAVSRAYCGQIPEAFADVRHALKIVKDDAHLLATLGLIGYRTGWVAFGSHAYSQAVSWFADRKEPASVVRAFLYWLREEVRVGNTSGEEELSDIREAIRKLPLRDQESDLFGLIKVIEEQQKVASAGPDGEVGEADLEELAARIDVPESARKLEERADRSIRVEHSALVAIDHALGK